MAEKKVIEVTEEIQVGNKILEIGDTVKVLKESAYPRKNEFIKALHTIYKEYTREIEEMVWPAGAWYNETIMGMIEKAQSEL